MATVTRDQQDPEKAYRVLLNCIVLVVLHFLSLVWFLLRFPVPVVEMSFYYSLHSATRLIREGVFLGCSGWTIVETVLGGCYAMANKT